ncbi:MAG TPA: hypothetical protein VGH10_12940 [Actinomycetota bacterium]
MRCEAAELALSIAMDESLRPAADVDEHVRDCPRCRAFSSGAWRVRERVRVGVAPSVPDLVPSIMAAVREQVPPRLRPHRGARRQQNGRTGWRSAVAVAAAVGVIAGFVVARGLGPAGGPGPAALASDIPSHLVQAARTLQGYRATFVVTERDWTARVPLRTFVASVSFRAPEDFRVTVRDTTRYPPGRWPRNDLSLVTNGREWQATGPDPCPPSSLAACAVARPVTRIVSGRPPFDAATMMPSDVIVPMTVLAAQDRVAVEGVGTVAGRPAVEVSMAYQDAAPLFQYLQFLGSWRPFFPQDRVLLWLDDRTWFPLRYEVRPAAGSERQLWAAQAGLPRERPGRPIFFAQVRGVLSTLAPPANAFAIRTSKGAAVSREGFRDLPASRAGGPLPADTEGLTLERAGLFARTAQRPYRETIAAYSRGLAWMTVTRVTGWHQHRLFGVGEFAQQMAPTTGSVGYYEPASAGQPRRIALHTRAGELVVATNLPRAALLRIAASLPLPGRAAPAAWFVHRWAGGVVVDGLTPAAAAGRMPFDVQLPVSLPAGYAAAAAQIVRTPAVHGVTIVYRRAAAELDGVGLQLYEASGQSLPPPMGVGVETVRVGGATARWSPDLHLLEWVQGGVYRSLNGPGFGLNDLVRIAASMRTGGGG